MARYGGQWMFLVCFEKADWEVQDRNGERILSGMT